MTTAEKVVGLIKYCLFKEEELINGGPPEDAVIVGGIVRNFGFHPGRLQEKRVEILDLVQDTVTDKFWEDIGGGASFLELPFDREGRGWGEQMHAEELMVLAMGVKHAYFPMPRPMWSALPGGVPYVTFTRTQKDGKK